VRLVLALDEPYRDVILYYHFEDLSWSEIGHRLGVSTTAVKSRLQRAHAQLRKRLERSLGKDPRVWSLLLLGSPFDAGALLSNSGGLVMGTKLAVAGTVLRYRHAAHLPRARSERRGRARSGCARQDRGGSRVRRASPRPSSPSNPLLAMRASGRRRSEPAQAAVPAEPISPCPPARAARTAGWSRSRARWRVTWTWLASWRLGQEIAELRADASVHPEPRIGGAVAYPLLAAPQGVSAEFEVARTQNLQYQSPLLSLRLAIEPPTGTPYLVSGSARREPDVHLTVFADATGKPLTLAITADFPIDTRLGGGAQLGKTPLSIHFSYDVADPMNSKAQLSWIEGDATQRGPIDWRFVGKSPAELAEPAGTACAPAGPAPSAVRVGSLRSPSPGCGDSSSA
jgi:hypothetical protein